MFFKDFFGMDEWPGDTHSSWSPRREQPFAGQGPCYADYNPYYGYASPVSSRRRHVPETDNARGRQSYYPFVNPFQAEIPVEQVRRNGRVPANQNHRSACSGCSECCPGYQTRRPATTPSRTSPQGNTTSYRQQRNGCESSSEESSPERTESRFSPPSRGLKKPLKKSPSTNPHRISPPKKSTSINSFRGNPVNSGRPDGVENPLNRKPDPSSVARESVKIQQPFAVSKSVDEVPIVVTKNAEAEDVEEMSTEATIDQQIPSQNTGRQTPPSNIPKTKTPADILTEIELETAALDERIKSFAGTTKDREYIIIDELITKALLRLDAVESNGDLSIRNARKALVKRVQALLTQLEQKVGIARIDDVQEGSVSDNIDSTVDLGDTIMADETNDCSDEPCAVNLSSEIDNNSNTDIKDVEISEVTGV